MLWDEPYLQGSVLACTQRTFHLMLVGMDKNVNVILSNVFRPSPNRGRAYNYVSCPFISLIEDNIYNVSFKLKTIFNNYYINNNL